MQNHTIEIRDRLLAGLDREYNVVDMSVVMEVLAQLEKIHITKEALEISRLGKHINELRRKSSDRNLANRAKSLVKKWRQLLGVAPPVQNDHHLTNGNSNGQALSSKPSSRLTSPKIETPTKFSNVGLSPGLKSSGLMSLHSSASTSPGLPLSRPSTPSQSSQKLVGQLANNKRRCEDEFSSVIVKNGPLSEPNPKRPRLNGNSLDPIKEGDQGSCDSFHIVPSENAVKEEVVVVVDTPTPKQGRKTKRQSLIQEADDALKQRMASVIKSSGKVRTTQELVQEMALRSHSPGNLPPAQNIYRANSPPNHLNKESKSELMNRFLESQSEAVSSPPDPVQVEEKLSNGHESIDDILAKLPVINASEVLASYEGDSEDEPDDLEVEGLIPVMKHVPDTGPQVLEELHEGQKESFNGNFSHNGEFREWFEVVSKRTKDEDLLYILPYSVIE